MLIGSRDESFQSNLSYLLLKGLVLGLGNLGSYIDPPFPALVQLMSKYSSEASDSGTFRTMGTPCPSTLCLKTCILSVRKPVPTHYGSKLREHRPTTCLHRLTCFRLTSCQTVVRARLHCYCTSLNFLTLQVFDTPYSLPWSSSQNSAKALLQKLLLLRMLLSLLCLLCAHQCLVKDPKGKGSGVFGVLKLFVSEIQRSNDGHHLWNKSTCTE